MAAPVIPADVIRLLSFHGPVKVQVGLDRIWARGSVEVAPFEDRIELFLPRNSGLEKALLACCDVQLIARKDTGEYSLRMEEGARGYPCDSSSCSGGVGAVAGGTKFLQQFMAAPFVPELLELVRTEAEDRVRYHGKRSAGEQRPRSLFGGKPAFGGRALFMAIGASIFVFVAWIHGGRLPAGPAQWSFRWLWGFVWWLQLVFGLCSWPIVNGDLAEALRRAGACRRVDGTFYSGSRLGLFGDYRHHWGDFARFCGTLRSQW